LRLQRKGQHSLRGGLNTKLAHMLSCIGLEVFLLINVFCVGLVIFCEKNVLWLAQVVSYFVLHRSKIPLVRPKLHICAACCSNGKMEVIV